MNTTALRSLPRQIFVIITIFAMLAIGPLVQAFTFDTDTTFSTNFREVKKTGNRSMAWDKAGKSMKIYPATSGVYIYDVHQGVFTLSNKDVLTVRVQLSMGTAKSSIGIYIIDPEKETKGYLALYNIDNTGSGDVIRFDTASSPSTGGAGAIATAENFEKPGIGLNETGTLVLTYGMDDNKKAVITLTMLNHEGAQVHTASYTLSDVRNPMKKFKVGLRIAAQAGRGDYVLKTFEAKTEAAR